MAAMSPARPAPPTSPPSTSARPVEKSAAASRSCAASATQPSSSLNPSSLNPSSLNPSSLNPSSLNRFHLLLEPDLGQILLEVMAGREVPALDRGRGGDDAVPPQEGHGISLGERVALELPHHLGAPARIGGHRLPDIEPVEEAVGRAGVIAGR